MSCKNGLNFSSAEHRPSSGATQGTEGIFGNSPSVALYTRTHSLSLAGCRQYNLSNPIDWFHIIISFIPMPVSPNDLFVSGFHYT